MASCVIMEYIKEESQTSDHGGPPTKKQRLTSVQGQTNLFRAQEDDNSGTSIVCDQCQLDGRHGHAEEFCPDCSQFMCKICSRMHRKSTLFRDHRLQMITRDQPPIETSNIVRGKFCAKHVGRMIKYWCEGHRQCCCSVCLITNHVHCRVAFIKDLAKGFSTSREYTDLTKQINAVERNLQESKEKLQISNQSVNRCFSKLVLDVNLVRAKINYKLDRLVEKAIEEANKIKESDKKNTTSLSTRCHNIQVDLNQMPSTLETLKQYRDAGELVICSKVAQAKVREYTDQIAEISQQNVRSYSLNLNVKDILNKLQSSDVLENLIMMNTDPKSELC